MVTNLFSDQIDTDLSEEQFHTLLLKPGVRIERIVSTGQASAPDYWYDQPQGEWVAVLTGEAFLRFKDEQEPWLLRAGDFVDIPPHRQHRVESTHPSQPTIWLAIYYEGESVS